MINLKKLLNENTEPKPKLLEASDHVRNGLEKVFAAGDPEISYRRVENVGLGYIKSISEAFKCALQESRKVAKIFGYRDDEASEKFIKEDHNETDMSNPEEKREVQIGKEILRITDGSYEHMLDDELMVKDLETIQKLARELIDTHTGKAVVKPGTGGGLYKPGSIY